jgi:uncharacterized membrane-anchored protein YjiN (DUF445 family)
MSKSANNKPESEVNAYLFYAQRTLYLLNSTSLIEQQVDKMALRASVCLLLKQAWESWLKELSSYVGRDIPEYASLLLAEYKNHPEVQCLLDVNKQNNNWLALMLSYFEPRLNTPSTLNTEGESEDSTLSARINVVQLEVNKELSDEEKLKTVMTEFKAYINTVRSRQAEW